MKLKSSYSRLILCMMSISLCQSYTANAEVQNLQINDIIIEAIDTHPSIAAALSEKKAAQEGIIAAKRNLLPVPSIRSGYQEDSDVVTQLTVRQPLWAGGRLTANVNQAIYDDKAAVEFVFEEQNKVAKTTIDAWQSYVNAIMSQRVYAEVLEQLGKFEQMMGRRVKQGVSASIEMDLVTNRIIQQQSLYQAAQEKERIAEARLEQILGQPLSKSISYTIPSLEKMVQEIKVESADYESMVFDEASFRNATVVREYFQIESAKQALKADKASNLPTVYAQYSHDFNHSDTYDSGQFSLGVNYEPGAGFANFALNKAAQARVDGLIQSQEASRRAVMEQIQVQYQQFASAKDKELSLIAASAGSRIVVDSYRRQFIAGRKSWLEVLNAVREQSDDKIKLVDTRTTMIGAFYKLQIDLGKMPWQEFQFNREKQPLFHPMDPVDKWVQTKDYVPDSLKKVPNSVKEFTLKPDPLHIKKASKKVATAIKQQKERSAAKFSELTSSTYGESNTTELDNGKVAATQTSVEQNKLDKQNSQTTSKHGSQQADEQNQMKALEDKHLHDGELLADDVHNISNQTSSAEMLPAQDNSAAETNVDTEQAQTTDANENKSVEAPAQAEDKNNSPNLVKKIVNKAKKIQLPKSKEQENQEREAYLPAHLRGL